MPPGSNTKNVDVNVRARVFGEKELKRLPQTLQKLTTGTGSVAAQFKQAGSKFQEITGQTKKLRNGVEYASSSIMKTGNITTKVSDKLSKNGEAIRDVTKTYKKAAPEVAGFQKEIINTNKGTEVWSRSLDANGKVIKSVKSEVTQSSKGLKGMSKNFNMAQLSAMFFGMAVKKVAEDIARVTIGTFMKLTEGSTESGQAMNRLAANMEYLKFSIGGVLAEALMPLIPHIIDIIQYITNWTEKHPKLTATILAFVGVVGTLLFLIGTLGLGITGVLLSMYYLGVAVSALATVAFYLLINTLKYLLIVAITVFNAILAHPFIAALIIGTILLNKAWKENWFGIRQVTGKFMAWIGPAFIDTFSYLKMLTNNFVDVWKFAFHAMVLGSMNAINWLIRGMNKIPGINLPEFDTSNTEKKMKELADKVSTSMNDTFKKNNEAKEFWKTYTDEMIKSGEDIDAGLIDGKGFLPSIDDIKNLIGIGTPEAPVSMPANSTQSNTTNAPVTNNYNINTQIDGTGQDPMATFDMWEQKTGLGITEISNIANINGQR